MTTQQNYNISLPDGVSAIDNPLSGGDRVTLPFECPYLYWHNGQAGAAKDASGVLHYGGWWVNADEAESLAGPLPEKFVRETWTNKEGGTYDVFATRSILAAVIASRYRWFAKKDASGNDTGGNFSRKQVLAYMAYSEADKKSKAKLIIPWGPVVLAFKGMAGQELDSAFKAHEQGISEVRREIASNVPWPYFYCIIGTFGVERVQKMVGKVQKSPITPPLAFVPSPLDGATLSGLFVSENIAAVMSDLREQAAEWLANWKAQPRAGEPANGEPAAAGDGPENFTDNGAPW